MNPFIRVYDDIVPTAFTAAAIDYFENAHEPLGKLDEEWRRCHQRGPLSSTPLCEPLKEHVRRGFERYRADANIDTLSYVRSIEDPTIFRYDPDDPKGPHRFHRHADAWSTETATRQVSLVLYLNDVVEGGETVFPVLDVVVQPRAGRLLVFPSSFLFEHEGRPPISGRKYIVVSWLHFGEAGTHARRTLPFL